MTQPSREILVVDPDPLFAGKLTAMLRARGYDVERAEGISQAAQRLRDVDFGCVIMDEDMPEMKGHDAVSVVRAISPRVPIIMTAARNTREQEARIRRQDIFFYYVKGFDMRELAMAARDALRKVGEQTWSREQCRKRP